MLGALPEAVRSGESGTVLAVVAKAVLAILEAIAVAALLALLIMAIAGGSLRGAFSRWRTRRRGP